MTHILHTPRLSIRRFAPDDAGFVLGLLNEPSFIENIGDRGVRTLEDAAAYLAGGPIASYDAHGHGLYHVSLTETGEPIGMCGLLRRAQFDAPDIGYAFLPAFWRRGFAEESVTAVLDHERPARVLALVSPHNHPSARLLEKLGFTFRETTRLDSSGSEVQVYELA